VAAQQRFHRYVAVLFATTAPMVAIVELVRALDMPGVPWGRLVGPLLLGVWAIVVSRAPAPNAVPLVLGGMVYAATVTVTGALFGLDITSFDDAAAFGLMMLLSVLAGTLANGNRLLWAGGLAVSVATWVITMGALEHTPFQIVGVRVVVAIAGVVFTTALVAELYDQLTSAIRAHDRARRLQEAVGKCSEALLVHSDAFALHEAVRAVFEATEADYAFIDRTVETESGPGWEIVASASRRVDETGSDWQTGRYKSIPTTYSSLLRGEASEIHTSDLTGAERDLYETDSILSELCVPIFVGDDFRGSIGFVEYTEDRRWSEDEVQTLWRAADMIGAYWRRHDDADALRMSNESKDKLLASVSHEIRTPLTAIVGLSEAIVSGGSALGPDELNELHGIIAVQSRELAELVEDLLVASRADFGNLSIRPERIDLADQVERVLEGLRESTPLGKSITFGGGSVTAWADPLRVRQIIRNLVTNAVKYGGDRIVVAVREGDDQATVVVADNGTGVADREVQLIFERYYRSDQSPTQPGSVGIGLSVSRQLAEMMDGTLAYVSGESQHRFELSLPMVNDPAATLVHEPA
jgi:signal transduction histidine kinase